MMAPDLRILVTGGTLDKIHDMLGERLAFAPDGGTHLPEILTRGRCAFPIVQQVLMKDSLDFTDADRAAILAAAQAAPDPALVITHGTGTMGETARFLAGHLPGKTVVLTGAMRPHSLGRSDAAFNLGGAIIAAQTLPPGIYGVMNGRVFVAGDLDKNTATGRFDD
ncbi:MAG: asparaginase domain-containing protein [Qingshengfaniella sp.]